MIHLLHNHKYSVADVENMIPFERSLIFDIIIKESQTDPVIAPPNEDME